MQRIGRRPRPPDQPGKPRVAGQDLHIFDALASRRLDEDDGTELVELREAPPAAPKSQVTLGHLVQPQSQHGLRHQGQPRSIREVHRLCSGRKHKGQNALAHAESVSREDTAGENTTFDATRLHPLGAPLLKPANQGSRRPLTVL
jgi:hypothetical protein